MKPLRFSFRKRAKQSSIRLCIQPHDLIELRLSRMDEKKLTINEIYESILGGRALCLCPADFLRFALQLLRHRVRVLRGQEDVAERNCRSSRRTSLSSR